MSLLFGRDLTSAAAILRTLVPAFPLVVLNTILFYVFLAARRRFVCIGTLGIGFGIGVVLTFYLSAGYGAVGCAVADVVRDFVMSAIYLYFLVQGNHARLAGTALLKIFLGATSLLLVAIVLTSSMPHSEQWLAAWIICVLTGTLVVLGFPRRGEWRLLTDDSL
jgi:O-antigen/teichoic acid export membrane protein